MSLARRSVDRGGLAVSLAAALALAVAGTEVAAAAEAPGHTHGINRLAGKTWKSPNESVFATVPVGNGTLEIAPLREGKDGVREGGVPTFAIDAGGGVLLPDPAGGKVLRLDGTTKKPTVRASLDLVPGGRFPVSDLAAARSILAVVDARKNQIVLFDAKGAYLGLAGETEELDEPGEIRAVFSDAEGSLTVFATENGADPEVVVVGPSGRLKRRVDLAAVAPRGFVPAPLDARGRIPIAAHARDRFRLVSAENTREVLVDVPLEVGAGSLAQGRPIGYDAAGNLYAYLYLVDAELHTARILLAKIDAAGKKVSEIDLTEWNDQFGTTLRVYKENTILALRNLQDRVELVALEFPAAKR